MGEELGRSVLFRDSYARTWALGDRKNPSCHTPILMQLINDIEIDQNYSPFICKVDNEIPAKMEVKSKIPLSPPDFSQLSPNWTASLGHVLPPSLDEADAGESADLGTLLPVSWQRLRHDSSLTDKSLNPAIVVLTDAVQLASQQGKLVKAIHILKRRFPASLLWTPGLGGPDNAAVLTWLGVDIFDLTRSRQCSSQGFYLSSNGPRKCSDSTNIADIMARQLEYWYEILTEIKSRISEGTLRNLAEIQSLNSPKLVEHLRFHDKLCRSDNDITTSHVPADRVLQCNSHDSLNNPIITQWVDYIEQNYRPPNGLDKVMILLPCSARKPYRMSKTHKKFLQAINHTGFHELMVTSPLGLVPRDLEEVWPASHYDIPVTGSWSADEINRTESMVKTLIDKFSYQYVINHSTMKFELNGVDIIDTRGDLGATSSEALSNLSTAISKLVEKLNSRNRKHHNILMDNFRSISRLKMEKDEWLKDIKIRGKPPYWKLEKDGKQIAIWSNERRGFSLSKSSVKIIHDSNSLKKITLKKGVIWKGDIFHNIIEEFDSGIKSGDDILVIQDDQPIGLARAVASGWEWNKLPGMLAKCHQRI